MLYFYHFKLMREFVKILKILCLFPLMLIYRSLVTFRNFLYDSKILKSHKFDMPIISVGNISVGGSGKTPHTEFLIEMLQDEYQVAVLSRGYKRKTRGFRLVEADDSFLLSGDEPLQIKQKFPNAIVAVCENRVKGISQLMSKFPDLKLIILDDAFQHRRVKPGLSILLNNFNHPINKDFLLPLGYLREPRSSAYRAHIVVFTKCPNKLKPIEKRILIKESEVYPYQYLFFTTYNYLDLKPVFNEDKKTIPISDLKKYNVVLFSGLAKHTSLYNFFKENSKSVKHIKFPDHHNFKKRDIIKIEKEFKNTKEPSIIVTTEKDAVKLKDNKYFAEETKKMLYCAPIKVEQLGSEEDIKQFNNQIFSYVRNNKRYCKLYKNAYSG